MELGERIMEQRKKRGWSQEDLAEQLDISRQSVSKWESGASTPDLDKIIRMSQLFGITTDALLTEPAAEEEAPRGKRQRCVTGQQAMSYLELTQRHALRIALAVAALVVSPTPLILMGGLSESIPGSLSESMAGGLGVAILLVIIAAAVAVLIRTGMDLEPYAFLEKECFVLEPGLEPVIRQRQADFHATYRTAMIAGVSLCITSVIPMMVSAAFQAEDLVYIICVDVLLVLVAVAVCLFVWSGMIHGSCQKLLQEGEYTLEEKKSSQRIGALPAIYWGTITAIYLGVSFYTMDWDRSWIVWPCAGVLFVAVLGIAKSITSRRDRME